MTCEHEINLISENWITDNKLIAEAECSLCLKKFRGELKEDETQ